jgi:hypothetical protein
LFVHVLSWEFILSSIETQWHSLSFSRF